MRLTNMIATHSKRYWGQEEELLRTAWESFDLFLDEKKGKDLKMSPPTTKAKLAFKPGEDGAWGWSSTTVRARPIEVMAYAWDTMQRSRVNAEELERAVDDYHDHNQLVCARERSTARLPHPLLTLLRSRRYIKMKSPKPLQDREYVFPPTSPVSRSPYPPLPPLPQVPR
jgi:hypothetical protein